jgi:hypothetical protein
MFKCVIHIYGLPREISDLREVEVELKDGASMVKLLQRSSKIPALEETQQIVPEKIDYGVLQVQCKWTLLL